MNFRNSPFTFSLTSVIHGPSLAADAMDAPRSVREVREHVFSFFFHGQELRVLYLHRHPLSALFAFDAVVWYFVDSPRLFSLPANSTHLPTLRTYRQDTLHTSWSINGPAS